MEDADPAWFTDYSSYAYYNQYKLTDGESTSEDTCQATINSPDVEGAGPMTAPTPATDPLPDPNEK